MRIDDPGFKGLLAPASLEDVGKKNRIAPKVAFGQTPGFEDEAKKPVEPQISYPAGTLGDDPGPQLEG